MNRKVLFALVNLGFIVLMAVCAASNDTVPLIYLSALFALCSSALLVARPFNGPYSILCLLLLVFFVFYGLQDVSAVLNGKIFPTGGGLPTAPEAVILVGCVLGVLGYVIAAALFRPTQQQPTKEDWPENTVVIVGIALWALGSWAAWIWGVELITDTKSSTVSKALGSISAIKTTMLMLGQLAKPVGMLMLAYAQAVYKRAWLLPLLIAVVAFQMFYGYVVDVKGEAMMGIALVIMTRMLVSAKLPKVWLGVGVLFVVLLFPIFMAHRMTASQYGADHAATVQNIGKSISRALEASQQDEDRGRKRSESFFERASLKGSVTTIVNKAGDTVPFRNGYTLTPLWTAFIPRLIWPDKPFVAAGQLMNTDFHISIFRETYISSSHLGELYWNYGWMGVLIGMPIIGLILGTVGARANLADRISLTRVLIMIVTIRYVVWGFEGNIGVSYVMWVRSVAAIGVLHLFLTNQRRAEHSQDEVLPEAGQTRVVSVP